MKKLIPANAPWEDHIGYSRAVRIGNVIEVSGTAPVKNGKTAGNGAYEQATVCLNIIKKAIEEAGGRMEDVVRTRIYVTDIDQWVAVGKAHGDFFKDVKPASTMVEVKRLIEPDMIVEIEATAVIH